MTFRWLMRNAHLCRHSCAFQQPNSPFSCYQVARFQLHLHVAKFQGFATSLKSLSQRRNAVLSSSLAPNFMGLELLLFHTLRYLSHVSPLQISRPLGSDRTVNRWQSFDIPRALSDF